jgi:hypothetical protein
MRHLLDAQLTLDVLNNPEPRTSKHKTHTPNPNPEPRNTKPTPQTTKRGMDSDGKAEAQANCRRLVPSEFEELDAVGTVYMVSADIFREGRAVYADHVQFTEHYPICLHARRMGRRVGVLTTRAARHANLPYYGESFHDNEFTLLHKVA